MSDNYRQCLLRKPTATGRLETVTWLPAKLARVGQPLTLRRDDGDEAGWEVAEVWGAGEPPRLPPSRFQKL